MINKNLFFLFLVFFAPLATATTVECENSREEFLKQNNDLYEEYKSIDLEHKMSEIKKAFWIPGNPKINKAVFIAHGYMGTPAEMNFIVEPLKKRGWTVVGFLLPGHGGNYKIANSYKNTKWVKTFKQQIELVTKCFSEVRAVGFSTGGLLIHNYLLNNGAPESLKSLHLISPYFIQRFGGSFDRMLGPLFNGISVDTAYFISRFRDLKVMTIDKEYYNQNLPVEAGLQVKDLGLQVYHHEGTKKQITIPVQLFLSEGDWTVDTTATKKVINRDYKQVQLFWYEGDEPHHLMCPSVSSVAHKIQKIIESKALEAVKY